MPSSSPASTSAGTKPPSRCGPWIEALAGGGNTDGASGGSGLENPPQRWGAKRKAEVVLRSLRGEALDALSRHTAVPVPRLEEWHERGLHGLEQALQTRDVGDPAQLRLDEANRRIGELSMKVELLRARCEKAGPFAGRRSHV